MGIAFKEFINKIFNKIKWDLCNPKPSTLILFLCSDAKKKNRSKEKETRRLQTVRKLNQSHVNSLRSNNTCLDTVSLTDCKHNDSQVTSSRINEVHCGIFEKIKRYRNSLHSCGMTPLVKCVAFTLAETLVVMGIIDVVAALTIPNLNQSTGDREKVAKVKKIYANLEDAFGRATAVYGPFEEWFVNDSDDKKAINKRLGERLTEFMKVSKVCEQTADTECFVDSIDDFGDYSRGPVQESSYKVILADGTSLSLVG